MVLWDGTMRATLAVLAVLASASQFVQAEGTSAIVPPDATNAEQAVFATHLMVGRFRMNTRLVAHLPDAVYPALRDWHQRCGPDSVRGWTRRKPRRLRRTAYSRYTLLEWRFLPAPCVAARARTPGCIRARQDPAAGCCCARATRLGIRSRRQSRCASARRVVS